MDPFYGSPLQNTAFMPMNEIRSVQIDHNSTCNLRCPQCARVHKGEINPELKLQELGVDFYKQVFTPDFCRQLYSVLFCGNYGDAIASSNIVEVVSYLKSAGLRTVSIFTNGSLRSTQWWTNFGRLMNSPRDKVVFSIDGLEDTNAVYRRGSHFNKIIENAKAFIDAGGRARWDYLVFAHNEHQVEPAQALAKELGFFQFKLKKTNRFIQDKNYKSGKSSTEDEVYQTKKSETQTQAPIATIKAPSKKDYQTKDLQQFEQIVKQYNSWFDYIDASAIDCKAQKERTVFIDFEGRLWPCTWVAAPLHFYGDTNTQKSQIKKLVDRYGNDFNNLYHHSLNDVLTHPWMAHDLTCSWKTKMDDDQNFKLMTCGRTCGNKYEFSSNASVNREILELKS